MAVGWGDDGTGSSSTFWVVQVVNRRKQNKWGRETQQDKTRNINNLKTSSTSKGAFQTPLFLILSSWMAFFRQLWWINQNFRG
jgi:hypothetical protein